MSKPAHELYDEDFYAWTQDQAEALRALKGHNRLDVDHLAEEVEDLGKSELHAIESWVEQIIAHMLKLDYAAFEVYRRHWRSEIGTFQRSLNRRLTRSLENKVKAGLDKRYATAVKMAVAGVTELEPGIQRRFPLECPYDWEAITERDVIAEAGFDIPADT